MKRLRRLSRFERWTQDFRDWLRALCIELYNYELFYFALFLNCVALVVVWFVGLR